MKKILAVLNDPNSNTSKWLVANGYGYLDETIPDVMAKTGATGKHVHIGMDTGLAMNYAKQMGAQYNSNVTPVFQIPGSVSIGEPLPPINNGTSNPYLYDANILAQNNALSLQNGEIARKQAQIQSIQQQEANAAAAKEEEERKLADMERRRMGANLALGLIGNMRQNNQKSQSFQTNTLMPLLSNMFASNMAAYGGNLFDGETNPTGQMHNGGDSSKKYTVDGRELIYAVVPNTGERRWIDFNDSKDFNGVTGYRFYDDAGNKMHYTQWKDADAQEPSPTVEDVDRYVESRGYNPDLTRPMWGLREMQEQGLHGVYPEFALLTGGRGLLNGAVDATVNGVNTVLSKPYVDAGLTSYFGAHGINDIAHGNANAWTALEVLPLMRPVKAIYDVGKPFAKELYDSGALWDKYTTFRGRFGNYGDNLATNIYGTLARNYGLPDKARIPADAMRKIKGDIHVDNGVVDLTGNKPYLGNPHVNATLDRGVVSHNKGQWDGANTYITPTSNFIDQAQEALKSIEPSDMFSNGARITEVPENVTLISGDIESLNRAREAGMQTLSSPKLRRIYNEALSKYNAEKAIFDEQYANATGLQKRLLKAPESPKYRTWWPEYTNEIQRLQARRGTPTLADFGLLEQQTGLNAGVAPKSEYYNALQQIETMKNASIQDIMDGKVTQYVYPNGRVVEWKDVLKELNLLKRAEYNKIFYDPASYVESNWKTINGVE